MKKRAMRPGSPLSLRWALLAAIAASASAWATAGSAAECNRTVHADVVALDQPFLWNRLGTAEPGGMIYALKGDVIACDHGADLKPGRVTLRPGKRPRPIVLRANVGDCLRIRFTNLLAPTPVNGSAVTRYAGVHIAGMDLIPPKQGAAGIDSDASWVGKNGRSLAAPGETRIYEYHAKAEGTFLLYNAADDVDDQGPASTEPIGAGQGLFGAVNVQPEWAEWYRSQVTRDDLREATLMAPAPQQAAPQEVKSPRLMSVVPRMAGPNQQRTIVVEGKSRPLLALRIPNPDKHTVDEFDAMAVDGRLYSPLLQPLIDYHAIYEGGPLRGRPVLKMLRAVVPEGQAAIITTRTDEFTDEQVQAAIESFNSQKGLATEALRQQFAKKTNIFITGRARVTGESANAWLLTDPGRGLYLIRLVEDQGGARRFEAYPAELHLVHSDLTAMITGPNADRFPYDIDSPSFFSNPVLPDRRQPYREFTIIYHQASGTVQPFPQYANKNTAGPFGSVAENFAINYGMAGIGSEILANRLGVGPMGNPDAVDLKYEEFFLSSWAIGDPAMVVDMPANAPNQAVSSPDEGSRASQQLLFTIGVTDDDRTMVELNNGKVVQKLSDAFKARGVTLSGQAIASMVVADSQWIVLDPYDANKLAPVDRGRYPIVATGSKTLGRTTTTTLSVYSGFPNAPGVLAYNGLAKTKATKAFYPDDPSNVYHSNIRDHVKFRILHAGPGPSHVHHLHAHQWLHSPGSAQSQYLDSQLIVPGSTYTLDIVHDGSGNRNLTVGDSIFHCHFYPHFAQGMWSLWRTHDVFEEGTWLDVNGRPVTHVADVKGRDRPVYRYTKGGKGQFFAYDDKVPVPVDANDVRPAWNRALPDGEIEAGTPIPAIVPLPSLSMPLLPAKVRLTDLAPFLDDGSKGQGRRVEVEMKNAEARKQAKAKGQTVPEPEYDNPGYPFFVPGIAGHRPPHPPMDFARQKDINGVERPLNGGLPRHVVLGGQIVKEYHTRWDFTRDFIEYDKQKNPVAGKLCALEIPEGGTPVEKAAMRHHSQRTHRSYLPNDRPGNLTRNGLPARQGAPYAPPEVDDYGNAEFNPRRYQAAVIQTDVVLNKQGWHFPQQRFLTLWEDVAATNHGQRAPQPLFFRGSSNDTIEFWHTNLVPSYYELDDFQVRTPTDVIGQHIHNVKFDVTSSDGGANGFNYEDGTFSPDEVRDRINAINRPGDAVSSRATAEQVLEFDTGGGLPDLGPQTVHGEKTWGTAPKPSGTVLARAKIRSGVAPKTTTGFFCSQHGRAMSGSLVVEAAGGAAQTIEIDGNIVGGKPTWTSGGNPADKVAVKPGDTVVWKATAGQHGVVFDGKGMLQFDDASEFIALGKNPKELTIVPVRVAYPVQDGVGDPMHGVFGRPPAGQDWDGAQTTIQRWDADPLLDNYGEERTLRTIFTHDHLGPSTHQQAGLYAGLVVEPENSLWYLPNGDRMNIRKDGGPTSWEGYVRTQQIGKSYREFLVEFQDTQLAYRNTSRTTTGSELFDPGASGRNASAAFDVAQYGDLARQQIAGFIANLNAKKVPDAFTGEIFPAMGIPLSTDATVTVVTESKVWKIQEPSGGALNAGETYEIHHAGGSNLTVDGKTYKVPDAMFVYTPGIHPAWADPQNALNSPTDGNNTGNGPPFAQLISSGAVGTYSMNYRNESVLTRVSPPPSGVAPKPNATDLAFVFDSIPRNIDALNTQPVPGSPINPGGTKKAPITTVQVTGTIFGDTPLWLADGQLAKAIKVNPGDQIVWTAERGSIGVAFNSEAEARPVLQFHSGRGLGPLGPQYLDGEAVWGTPSVGPGMFGRVLARATVKPDAPPGTTIEFFCTRHGRSMRAALATPGTAKAATIEIDGDIVNGTPTWTFDGKPATKVTVNPGDTIVWKAVSGTHGVVFNTEAAALTVLSFDPSCNGAILGPQTVKGEPAWGTAPQPTGSLLARATVKSGVAPGTTLGFFCSQHGRPMSGSLATPAGAPASNGNGAVAAAPPAGPSAAPAAGGFTYPAYLVPPTTKTGRGGVEPTDPFTPLMRAYAHDNVQVRVLVGAHTQAHAFQIQGLKWLYEPDYPESGYKNAQAMGISEHFEMLFRLPQATANHGDNLLPFADYLLSPSSSVDGLANGAWGILRAFGEKVGTKGGGGMGKPSPTYLEPLPNNPLRELPDKQKLLADRVAEVKKTFASSAPLPKNFKRLKVHATTVYKAMADRPTDQRVLSYNPRFSKSGNPDAKTYDLCNALLFVRDEDLVNGKTLKKDAPVEPLILRVSAGDWVELTLVNDLLEDPVDPALTMTNELGTATPFGNGSAPLPQVPLSATRQAGLHPAMVGFNVTEANGVNVGFNPKATVDAGKDRKFYWYAGDVSVAPIFDANRDVIGRRVAETPIEYGGTNLVPTDLMVQPQFGMVGALIVEPEGSTWTEDAGTHASATVRPDGDDDGSLAFRPFRDFVLVVQNLVANNQTRWGAINYRTETFLSRFVDPVAADSRAVAGSVLEFQSQAGGQPLPTLKPRVIKGNDVWGTAPWPMGTLLAQATVKGGVAAGTVLDFYCSQHGLAMSGSLAVQAAGGAPATVEIDGNLVGGTPTWTFKGNPADKVPVKPGDTVVWKAVDGTHGVVFNPKPLGVGYAMAFSNRQLIPPQDPVTPVFRAAAGSPVRFRLVMPSTSTNNALVPPVTFDIHGHGWPEEPFVRQRIQPQLSGSYAESFNPFGLKIGRNVRSQFLGSQLVAPYESFNFVIDHAGGEADVEGDYLYEALQRTRLQGLWGLFRVEKDLVVVTELGLAGGQLSMKGLHQPSDANLDKPATVSVQSQQGVRGDAQVNSKDRSWTFSAPYSGALPLTLTITSSLGGNTTVRIPDPSTPASGPPSREPAAEAHR